MYADDAVLHPRRAWNRTLGAVLAIALLLSGLAVLRPSAAGATTEEEEQFFTLTNQSRSQNGLGPLAPDSAAAAVARTWAQQMATSHTLSHNPSLAAQVDSYVTSQWTRIGENVGYGGSPSVLQTAFMNSPAHRANILGDYNRVGIGTAHSGDGLLWVTVVFVKGPALPLQQSFAPFATASALVAQQYRDFLKREPDPVGTQYWAGLLDANRTTPPETIRSFLASGEFANSIAPAVRLYFAYFRRVPDYSGLQYWMGRVRQGTPLVDVSNNFVTSPEFVTTYGSLSDGQFVDRVYENVLGRAPDAGGYQHWVGMLASGQMSRGAVMTGFSESAEYAWKMAPDVQVTMVYVGMLQRTPDATGSAYWTDQVRRGASVSALIAGFFSSTEYRQRFA